MAYPKYIRDPDDGCVLKLNDSKSQWENELEGCSIDIENYKYYKDGYENSDQVEYDEYNKHMQDNWDRNISLKNKDWKIIIQILEANENGKVLSERIKNDLDHYNK